MRFAFIPILCLLSACALLPQEQPDRPRLSPVAFTDLEGWDRDNQSEALAAFKRSCTVGSGKPKAAAFGIAGSVAAWQRVCSKAALVLENDAAARSYFENEFSPYAVLGANGSDGLFTGYYMPELRGSLKKTNKFRIPLYAKPKDLITADLGAFKSDLKGYTIVGKVKGDRFIPYDERKSIAKGSLRKRAKPVVWVDDPVDAFFLEIQGSGLIRLPSGKILAVGYEKSNGRAYEAIGRLLANRGELQRPVSMTLIREFLGAHPDRAQEIMNWNPSYIFFRRLPTNDPVGAQGVGLTAARSMAVDPGSIPLGVPLWLQTSDSRGCPLQRLMVAQDTGGAIKGIVRGDFYWGTGVEAAAQAGSMQSRGRYFILVPKEVVPDAE